MRLRENCRHDPRRSRPQLTTAILATSSRHHADRTPGGRRAKSGRNDGSSEGAVTPRTRQRGRLRTTDGDSSRSGPPRPHTLDLAHRSFRWCCGVGATTPATVSRLPGAVSAKEFGQSTGLSIGLVVPLQYLQKVGCRKSAGQELGSGTDRGLPADGQMRRWREGRRSQPRSAGGTVRLSFGV